MKTFYTYEDWTLESTPRCFYVGKGDDDRVIKLKRNKEHGEIVCLFGHNRVIVLTTLDESAALDLERKLIKKRHTHLRDPEYNGIGCNKTLGGQGNSGRIVSEETCRKISEAKKGKHPNKIWTQSERDATSARMSLLHKGKKISDSHKQVLKDRMADQVIKGDMIVKVSKALNEKYQNDPEFYQHIVETRARGEKHEHAHFTEHDVRTMRLEWERLDRSHRGSTKIFCECWASVGQSTCEAVYAIVTRKSWKHIV